MDIPLSRADYQRDVPKEAHVLTRNRYFEQNPVLTKTTTALIARPALRRFLPLAPGPIRGIRDTPGSFADASFVVSGNVWWRVDIDETTTNLLTGVRGEDASVSMAGTGNIGETPEVMYLADGTILWAYIENGYAHGTLAGTPANTDVVRIGATYYKFTNASVDAGTPDGTVVNPWLVALGVTALLSLTNLKDAINAAGVEGTQYSTGLTANTSAQGFSVFTTNLTVRAFDIGALGNSVVTTETGAALAWTGATLTGGGDPVVFQVQMPDDVGAISVGYIASHVVVIPAQGEGINGRFYWIEPGEITIDPLNFATAERAPDPIFSVVVFSDQFWLPGEDTTEVWYFTGNQDTPVLRVQGVTFDRGTWEGTALQIKESMVIVDSDGGVFQIAGGLKRISNPSIEERIRVAMARQAALL